MLTYHANKQEYSAKINNTRNQEAISCHKTKSAPSINDVQVVYMKNKTESIMVHHKKMNNECNIITP